MSAILFEKLVVALDAKYEYVPDKQNNIKLV